MDRPTLKLMTDNYYNCLNRQQHGKQNMIIEKKTKEAKKSVDKLLDSGTAMMQSSNGQYQIPVISAYNEKDCAFLKNVLDKLTRYRGFEYQFSGGPNKCSIEMSWKN